ncbi:MAG: hypothetical protein WDA42_06955, partial [Candidatus Bathyarchaeia archaeon]
LSFFNSKKDGDSIVIEQINISSTEQGLRSKEAITKYENALLTDTITEEEWKAILEVETNLGTFYTESGPPQDGAAQIQTTCIRDVNRILGETRYTFADRYDPYKIREIFNIYTNYYAGFHAPFEVRARIWNGGPNGASEEATIGYWGKVKQALEEQH